MSQTAPYTSGVSTTATIHLKTTPLAISTGIRCAVNSSAPSTPNRTVTRMVSTNCEVKVEALLRSHRCRPPVRRFQ